MKVSKFFIIGVVLIAMVIGFSTYAHAALDLIGQGTSTYGTYNLIYDTDLNITWYDYANPFTSQTNQLAWADTLSVTIGGTDYVDWRLPIVFDQTCSGYNCTNSEMGHLFYTELGNSSGSLSYTGDFENINNSFWTATGHTNPSYTWDFNLRTGYQYVELTTYPRHGIAVMEGSPIVPEPISSTLFIIGGATLGFRRFRKNIRNI